jgi:hypothetical protein
MEVAFVKLIFLCEWGMSTKSFGDEDDIKCLKKRVLS